MTIGINGKYIAKNTKGYYEIYKVGSDTLIMTCDVGELNETIEELREQ